MLPQAREEVLMLMTSVWEGTQEQAFRRDLLIEYLHALNDKFGAIFEQAALGGAVAITKHDTPKAVLLSYAEFESLVRSRSPALEDRSRNRPASS